MLRTLLALTLFLATAATTKAQWQVHDAHTTADLRGIDNVGNGVAWASGSDGTILRTEDAGFVWQLCAKPPNGEHLDFRAIQAFDNNIAIIMSSGKGDLSRLYKTTDGCQTWKLIFTNPDKDGFWDALRFSQADFTKQKGKCLGRLLGDPVNGYFQIFLSLDCGATWERQSKLPKALEGEGAFAASNSSVLSSGAALPSIEIVTGGPLGARKLSYYNYADFDAPSGEHPTNKPPYYIRDWLATRISNGPQTSSSGAFALGRSSANHIIVVGGDYTKPGASQSTAWYWDENRATARYEFLSATTPPHGYRSAVAYDATTKTWITVGPNGTDISTDDGRNWRALHPYPKFNDTPDADQHWNALSLPYAVGPHGRIATLRPSALSSAK